MRDDDRSGARWWLLLVGATACGSGVEPRHTVSTAVDTVLRRPAAALAPAPIDAASRPYAICDAQLRALGIDVGAENAEASRTARAAAASRTTRYDAIVVPGYTPLDLRAPSPTLHPIAQERLTWAEADLRAGVAPLVILSGGAVHPHGTPHTEALMMKRFLIGRGVPAARIAVEPCARHSHTNLRNSGRFMLAHGLRSALVVTSPDQAMYFGRPRSSTFDARCLVDLGYLVGKLEQLDERRVAFVPSGRTFDRGADPLDP